MHKEIRKEGNIFLKDREGEKYTEEIKKERKKKKDGEKYTGASYLAVDGVQRLIAERQHRASCCDQVRVDRKVEVCDVVAVVEATLCQQVRGAATQ